MLRAQSEPNAALAGYFPLKGKLDPTPATCAGCLRAGSGFEPRSRIVRRWVKVQSGRGCAEVGCLVEVEFKGTFNPVRDRAGI